MWSETAGAEHMIFTLSMCQRFPPWTNFGLVPQPECPLAAAVRWGAPKVCLLAQLSWKGI